MEHFRRSGRIWGTSSDYRALAGLGLNPLYAAGLCLIANTAPAFGAMGIPITVAGQVTGIDPHKIGQMAGHQLPFLSLFVPFFIVFLMDGFKGYDKRGLRYL